MAVGAKVILHFLPAFPPFSVLRCCALLLLFPLCTVWSVVCLNCTRKQQTFLNMIVMSVYTDIYRKKKREREEYVCVCLDRLFNGRQATVVTAVKWLSILII